MASTPEAPPASRDAALPEADGSPGAVCPARGAGGPFPLATTAATHRGIAPSAATHEPPLTLRMWLRVSGLEALVRLAWLSAALTFRHVVGALHDALRPGGAATRRARRVERSAVQTVAVLGELKGAFAKAGQFAASRADLLPAEVQPVLARLRDRVPPIAFSQVRSVIEAELGRPLVDVFARIHMRPLGAASIAQVHLARLHDGREVAVKVQYPWLRPALRSDLRLLRAGTSFLMRLRGADRAAALRVFDEFAAALHDELDFEREARVATQIAANLADDPEVVVPRVHADLTTRRVLVLDRSEGIPLGDPAALDAAGIPRRALLEVLVRAYSKQIFVDGLFHADPHPGNLFALPGKDDPRRPRVVFLDFGLSRRLDPRLRHAIREAIFAVLQRDTEGFVARMQALGMIAPGAEAGVRTAVGTMFARMSSGGSLLGQSGSQVLGLKDEAKALLRETPGLQLPTDLLLYARTLSYLFALGASLDPEVDMMKLTVPHLLRFLAEREAPAAGGGAASSAAAPLCH